jgi:hypothetical protein
MKSRLLTSTLLAAALIGAPAVAFAQSDSAATKPEAMHKTMHHSMSSQGSHFRAGTTTGLGSTSAGRARPGGQSVARKPAD